MKDGFRYLLLTRFALYNAAALALLIATFLQGWLDAALQDLTLWLCAIITIVFIYGLVRAGFAAWGLSLDLNAVRAGKPRPNSIPASYLLAERKEDDALSAELLRVRLIDAVSPVRHIADTLVLLGLVGTVVGFILALSGIEANTAMHVDKIGAIVATLISGIGVALYTTLLGAVFHLWLGFNYRLLVSATVRLYGGTIELGQQHVA